MLVGGGHGGEKRQSGRGSWRRAPSSGEAQKPGVPAGAGSPTATLPGPGAAVLGQGACPEAAPLWGTEPSCSSPSENPGPVPQTLVQ